MLLNLYHEVAIKKEIEIAFMLKIKKKTRYNRIFWFNTLWIGQFFNLKMQNNAIHLKGIR
jgi:hypothetical protein